MTCISRPSPESLSSSCTSSRRQVSPLIAYSLPPLRNRVRLMVTSAYSIGSAPSELSMVRMTSARPRGPLVAVPAKMTSSILPPRRVFAPCSPMTQARASTTLDLPEPFGPTTQVTPSSKANVVDCANDLNPLRVRLFRYTYPALSSRPKLTGQRYRTADAGSCRHSVGRVGRLGWALRRAQYVTSTSSVGLDRLDPLNFACRRVAARCNLIGCLSAASTYREPRHERPHHRRTSATCDLG